MKVLCDKKLEIRMCTYRHARINYIETSKHNRLNDLQKSYPFKPLYPLT